MIRLALSLILLCLLSGCHPVFAASIPVEARQYQRELTRNARVVWGLNAPVSTFAAQIHQESQWNARARSPVGAQGLAQFMPATASWIAGIYPDQLKDHQPYNPSWAMRALVRYNRWHWQRIPVPPATVTAWLLRCRPITAVWAGSRKTGSWPPVAGWMPVVTGTSRKGECGPERSQLSREPGLS